MHRSSVLVLLCLSGAYSAAMKKEPAEEKAEAAKSKRHATHQAPCPPEHSQPQQWQPQNKVSWSMSPPKVQLIHRPTVSLYTAPVQKQIVSYVKPQSSGWQQPHSSGWQQQSSGWQQQQKWQIQSSVWQQPQKWQPEMSGWQQQKWQPPSSGWQQQKWEPPSSGWQQQKWQPPTSGWQHQSTVIIPHSTGMQHQKWQPQPSVWLPEKWQPQSSGWQPHSSGWQQSSGWQPPKVTVQKPVFSYAPLYNKPMAPQFWASSAKPTCPPCESSHGAIHYAPVHQPYQIKVQQIKYSKPEIHPPVHLPPSSQHKIWEAPCD